MRLLAVTCLTLTVLAGAAGLRAAPPGAGSGGEVGPAGAVAVSTRREGNVTRFIVENREACEVTMTFEVSLVNMTGSVALPYTATFPAQQTNEAFSLSPVEPGARWSYSYTNYFKLGSSLARHDDSCVYELPYSTGGNFKVTQGYNGKFSHKGPNQYAIDWQMPEGTLVRAARAGVVVRVKDDSDKSGSSMDYDRYNNFVLVRHEDGTLGHYCHLQKGGCLVKVGQPVEAGDPIAHSGNTGFSTGAHLHFCVFKARDGHERVSIPIKFRVSGDKVLTLASGHRYRASEVQTASAKVAATTDQAVGAGLQ